MATQISKALIALSSARDDKINADYHIIKAADQLRSLRTYARPASMKRIKQLAFTNGMSDESYLEMLVNKAEGVGSV